MLFIYFFTVIWKGLGLHPNFKVPMNQIYFFILESTHKLADGTTNKWLSWTKIFSMQMTNASLQFCQSNRKRLPKKNHIIISECSWLFTVCSTYGSSEIQNTYLKEILKSLCIMNFCMCLECFKETIWSTINRHISPVSIQQ